MLKGVLGIMLKGVLGIMLKGVLGIMLKGVLGITPPMVWGTTLRLVLFAPRNGADAYEGLSIRRFATLTLRLSMVGPLSGPTCEREAIAIWRKMTHPSWHKMAYPSWRSTWYPT